MRDSRFKIQDSKKSKRGFSLFEILVVLLVFSIIAILTTESLINTLRSSRKAEAQARVRANLEYAMAIMERNIRGAKDIEFAPMNTCENCIEFEDIDGNFGRFVCDDVGGYIASRSAEPEINVDVRLTSDDVFLDCTPDPYPNLFTVNEFAPPGEDAYKTVDIFLSGYDVNVYGAEGASVTLQSKILLRNF